MEFEEMLTKSIGTDEAFEHLIKDIGSTVRVVVTESFLRDQKASPVCRQ